MDNESESKDLVAEALGAFVNDRVPDPTGLVGALIQKNYNDYAATMNSLTEGYKRDLDVAQAERDIIRADISAVFDSPYMPSPSAVLAFLWPSEERVKALIEEREHNWRAEALSFRGGYE